MRPPQRRRPTPIRLLPGVPAAPAHDAIGLRIVTYNMLNYIAGILREGPFRTIPVEPQPDTLVVRDILGQSAVLRAPTHVLHRAHRPARHPGHLLPSCE